jgi:hypothetical protein
MNSVPVLSGEPLVILGSFRSGTSCLATAVAELGVFLGDKRHLAAEDQFNPGGYWELDEMQTLNAKCLAAYGMNYFQSDRLPADWRERPGSDAIIAELSELLKRHFAGKNCWGWKEPATTILMPLYKEVFAKEKIASPRYPIMVRHPLSVAASQVSRQKTAGHDADLLDEEGKPLALGGRTVGIWLHYTLSALKESQGQKRQLVTYERYLRDPRPYLDQMANDLLGCNPKNGQLDAAVATVNPSWNHSKFSDADLKTWPDIVRRAYDCCLRADKDFDGFNSGKFDAEIGEMWDEWAITGQMARMIPLPVATMFFAWQGGSGIERTAHKYSPTDSWQTVRVPIDAPPGAEIQFDPHQLPCQLWIKKAVWHVDGREFPAALKPGPNGIMENLGTLRLSVFGACPARIQACDKAGPAELALEFMVLTGEAVITEVLSLMRNMLERSCRASAPLEAQRAQPRSSQSMH